MSDPVHHFPGPVSKKMLDEILQYVIYDPYPFAVDIAQCKGMWLVTVDGERIFDWAGLYASRLLGYNREELQEPDYLRSLAFAANIKICNPDFLTPECLAYYRLLHELAPACMKNPNLEVYAVNSGAEAIENMMKYLINLFDRRLTEKGKLPATRRFIYFDQAFHGRTVFALNVTNVRHDPLITKNFQGIIPHNIPVQFPALSSKLSLEEQTRLTRECLDTIEELIHRYPDEIVGIIVEPIQGAGGHRLAQTEFYQGLSRLAHDYNIGLGFDEVQTAGGQTGAFFSVDLFDLPYPPDAIAAAKKMANGVVYMYRSMDDCGVLDSTWGGSLADMVRFVREMKIVRDEKLLEQVPQKTNILCQGIDELCQRYPQFISDRRGLGLYQGFTAASSEIKNQIIDRALEQENMLLLGAGPNSIRLRSPIDVTVEDVQLFLTKLENVLKTISV